MYFRKLKEQRGQQCLVCRKTSALPPKITRLLEKLYPALQPGGGVSGTVNVRSWLIKTGFDILDTRDGRCKLQTNKNAHIWRQQELREKIREIIKKEKKSLSTLTVPPLCVKTISSKTKYAPLPTSGRTQKQCLKRADTQGMGYVGLWHGEGRGVGSSFSRHPAQAHCYFRDPAFLLAPWLNNPDDFRLPSFTVRNDMMPEMFASRRVIPS